MELVVRGNSFFTVGDDHAELTQIKRGDIVFNHKLLWTYTAMCM